MKRGFIRPIPHVQRQAMFDGMLNTPDQGLQRLIVNVLHGVHAVVIHMILILARSLT